MTTTIVMCSKCGATEEFGTAGNTGWIIAGRKDRNSMIIRCHEHITSYALEVAGIKEYRAVRALDETNSILINQTKNGFEWCIFGNGWETDNYHAKNTVQCYADAFDMIETWKQQEEETEDLQ